MGYYPTCESCNCQVNDTANGKCVGCLCDNLENLWYNIGTVKEELAQSVEIGTMGMEFKAGVAFALALVNEHLSIKVPHG